MREHMHGASFQVTKRSSLQMETGKGLARHQDEEVMEALASGELRKLSLRNLDFYPPIIGR